MTATLSNSASQRVDTTFVADETTAEITAGNLTVTTDNAIANGTATNAVQATVTDANGNPVSGQAVSFSADNGAEVSTVIGTTGADGIATATLTNTVAGISAVTATLSNSASQRVDTTFVADDTTAEITAGNLTVTTDNAIANGTATNGVQATVTDANGNPVSGQAVSFSADNGAEVSTVIGTTGADGIATATLTNT
ncbi:Ig-like domain-containing protein, partial [Yersinia pekkanenii]|uniref:Ig-like domain-containing protein n=1 Tax=Yersinia pekkanenii TaxID=1288385 RepID=UPI00399D5AEE